MHATKTTVMPSRTDNVALLKNERVVQLVKEMEAESQKRSQARIRSLISASARGLKYMEETSVIGKTPASKKQMLPAPPDILFLPKPSRDRTNSIPSLALPVELRRSLPAVPADAVAFVTTSCFPPYLTGSPLDLTTTFGPPPDLSNIIVELEQAHPNDGSLEVYASTFDGDSTAQSGSGFTFRVASAQIAACVYAVPPLPGPAQLLMTAHVHSDGCSNVVARAANPTGGGLIQLALTLDASLLGGQLAEGLAFPHCRQNPAIIGGYDLGQRAFNSENDVNTPLTVSGSGDEFVFMILRADITTIVNSGSSLILTCNGSFSEFPMFPAGHIRLQSIDITIT